MADDGSAGDRLPRVLGAWSTAAGIRTVAAALLIIVASLSYRSVFIGLAVTAFFLGRGSMGALAAPIRFRPSSWGNFGLALIPVLFAYDGWAWAAALGGEVRDPRRVLPRAFAGGVIVVILVYLIVNAAYLHVLPMDRVAASPLVASDAMTQVAGRAGGRMLSVLIMLSVFGGFCSVFLADPRVFFAMANDGQFFRKVGAVHPRYGTPHLAVALVGNALVQHTRSSLFGLALLLAGKPVYYARRWFKPAALGVTGLDP